MTFGLLTIVQSHPDTLSLVRELYSRCPEARDLAPWELQHLLWNLGYTNCIAPEGEIAAAVEVARTDWGPDAGAA